MLGSDSLHHGVTFITTFTQIQDNIILCSLAPLLRRCGGEGSLVLDFSIGLGHALAPVGAEAVTTGITVWLGLSGFNVVGEGMGSMDGGHEGDCVVEEG